MAETTLTADISQTGPLVLFDGVCNLCSASVQFLAGRVAVPLWYASMQSDTGRTLLARHGLPSHDYDSFIFLENGRLYFKSDAAFRLMRLMHAPWPALHWLSWIPRPLCDWVYDRVARNRYRLFGKRDSCMVPPRPDLAARFLE